MSRRSPETVEADILVIGSGLAGLWAAVAARDVGCKEVALVDKSGIGLASMSRMAGRATIFCLPGSTPTSGLPISRGPRDTCAGRTSSVPPSTVRARGSGAWRAGVSGTSSRCPWPVLTCHFTPAGLSRRGCWSVRAGETGPAVRLLLPRYSAQARVRKIMFFPKVFVTALLESGGRACGAVGIHRLTGETAVFGARALVLAGGDCSFGGNYGCVDQATGDAFRLA